MVDNELEVARKFTWVVLGIEDGNFWHLGGVTRWNSQILKYTCSFLAIVCVASQLFLCLFWIHLWVKNRCLQHPCFKNLCKIAKASKNHDSNAQHFLSDLLTHSWFHSMLFALPGYQFPYTVMNRCLYLNHAPKDISNCPSKYTIIYMSTHHASGFIAIGNCVDQCTYTNIESGLIFKSTKKNNNGTLILMCAKSSIVVLIMTSNKHVRMGLHIWRFRKSKKTTAPLF